MERMGGSFGVIPSNIHEALKSGYYNYQYSRSWSVPRVSVAGTAASPTDENATSSQFAQHGVAIENALQCNDANCIQR
jgi:hypothetical protein